MAELVLFSPDKPMRHTNNPMRNTVKPMGRTIKLMGYPDKISQWGDNPGKFFQVEEKSGQFKFSQADPRQVRKSLDISGHVRGGQDWPGQCWIPDKLCTLGLVRTSKEVSGQKKNR